MVNIAPVAPTTAVEEVHAPTRDEPPDQRAQRLLTMLFLAPTVIGLFLFTVVPIIASVLLAFFRWDIISTPKFVGMDNFADIVTDPTVRVSFLNTFAFVVVAVACSWPWRSASPCSCSPGCRVAARVLPLGVLLPADPVGRVGLAGHGVPVQPGVRPRQLGALRRRPPRGALADHEVRRRDGGGPGLRVAELRLHVPALHRRAGGHPRDVYEAASIDGATGWRQFRYITLPLLSPTMLVASVMAIISALQIFDQPYVLTRGGPGDSTRTAVMVIYESAFQQLEFGRASAIGIVLTLIIIGVTALQFRLSRRFVFYQ